MICRIARAYSLDPVVVAKWPFRRYQIIRNELIQSWKDERDAANRALAKARGDSDEGITVIDMDKQRVK